MVLPVESANGVTYMSLGNLVLSGYGNVTSSDETLSDQDRSGLYETQLCFHFFMLNFILGQLSYEAQYNKEIGDEVEDATTTAADYAIILYDLPRECKTEHILECFKDERTVKNAYGPIYDKNVPDGEIHLVEDMCCACFDVKVTCPIPYPNPNRITCG